MLDHFFHYLQSVPHLRGTVSRYINADGAEHNVLSGSEKRRGIVFSCDLTNGSSFVVRPGTSLAGNGGFNVSSGQVALVIRYEDFGSLVQGPWTAQTAGIGGVLTMVEVLEE